MKILVISLAGIGDTLFATPLIHELRANFPEATIDVLVKEAGARDLLENNPHINRVFYKNLMTCGKLKAVQFLRTLRRECYQFSVNTHPQSRRHYRVAAAIVGAHTRISHEYEVFNWLDRRLVNRTLPQDYSIHAAENNLALLPLFKGGEKLTEHAFEIYLTQEEIRWAEDYLSQNELTGEKNLGVHVGSGGTKNLALRRWPLDNYIELARQLRQSHPDLRVVFFGGPDEKTDHEKLRSQVPGAIFPPTKNLRQAAALIGKCTAFLSVDTAMMNLATAMKTRGQIIIETPTWNKPIEPYGNPFTLVKNPAINGRNLDFYRYDGRGIKGTPGELLAIMKSVRVEDVLAVVSKMI